MTIDRTYMNSNYIGTNANFNTNFAAYSNPYVTNNPFIISMQIQADSMAARYKQMSEYTKKIQAQMAELAKNTPVQQHRFNFTTPLFNTTQTVSTQSNNNGIITTSNPTGSKISRNNNQYGAAFLAKVKEIAKRLNCNYRDLLAVMNAESGISATAKNPTSSASGLIQFVESTARSLGTTTAALRAMSPIDQLDYVEKYLRNAKSAAGFSPNEYISGGQLYALIFLPARAKREVLTAAGENYYFANRGLDLNKDGKINKSELDQRIKRYYVSDKSFLA